MQDLNDKITGDTLTAAEWNEPATEIQNIIEGLGITLSGADLNQLGKAIAGYVANGSFYTDSGAADAYVLSAIGLKQAPTAYTDGMAVEFLAGNTNAGASTVNVGGLGNKNIIGTSGGGEIVAGNRYVLRYRTSSSDFEIIAVSVQEIRSITGTVAANALTLGIPATTLDFRSASLTNGSPNTRTSAAISLVVPSGATLGTVNTVQSRLVLLAIDNAGTVELAIVNLAGGVNLDETTLISTVAIDATADSANVIYSTTLRNNVPFRVVGYIESTQAVAGTWATSPSTLQGSGGNALTAMSSIGYGQTWQDVIGSRTSGVTYYNTTGKPIDVRIRSNITTGVSQVMEVNSVEIIRQDIDAGGNKTVGAIVPAGASYKFTCSTINVWAELR